VILKKGAGKLGQGGKNRSWGGGVKNRGKKLNKEDLGWLAGSNSGIKGEGNRENPG